ncbi:sulfite oxidase heme-binding subunit YedZ [Chthonobacter albigriseus]|uniref:sulfite oxidase heme-binding subunit YedZ n=1 Tax=Chthonobacter albigriseus TaxID=1683161 RepID=UPI001FCE4DB0|nr:ferric reductase-like transmembrane domain-containing protein [Chthonobacter albigriseus]
MSPLKLIVFAGILAPGLWVAWKLGTGTIGAKPLTIANHETGDWAIRFLLLSLLVSPLRRIADWPRLINVRRMLGLAALGYALIHLTLYVADQNWKLGTVALEIILRVYLLIGFVALVGLAVLGVTSTDAAIKRLGRTWNTLHRIVYGIALLGIIHFFLQSKIDVSQATLMAGFFLVLMAYRLAQARGWPIASPLVLVAIAVGGGLATAAVEYAWYALATGVPADRVLAANLQFAFRISPAWWVFAAGVAMALIPVLHRLTRRPGAAPSRGRQAQSRPARQST